MQPERIYMPVKKKKKHMRRQGRAPPPPPPRVLALVSDLHKNKLTVLHSDHLPRGRKDWLILIIKAALASKALRVARILGSLVDGAFHSEVLQVIADRLPGSNVFCLNVGEFEHASPQVYLSLVHALAMSRVAHLYWHDPDPVQAHTITMNGETKSYKEWAKHFIAKNRFTDWYMAQMSDERLWARIEKERRLDGGAVCKAWWDIKYNKDARLKRKEKWDEGHVWEGSTALGESVSRKGRCKSQRCRAVSRRKKTRCGLCTKKSHGYCHLHSDFRTRRLI